MKPNSPAPRERLRPDPEAHAFLTESAVRRRAEEVKRARAFARIEAGNHFLLEGCAGVAEYGSRIGYGSDEARRYAAAGHVMSQCPEAAQRVLDGEMTITTLSLLAPLMLEPGLRPSHPDGTPKADLDILAWARLIADRTLRRYLTRHRRDRETGETTVARRLDLTHQGLVDLDRTQILESRRKKRAVSQGEAVESALREYVERHDATEQTPGARRSPEMPERQDGGRHPRSVPAEVKRELMRLHGDECAIGACENHIFLENSHHTPHALGGGNEARHQARICSLHHRMEDHGDITWVPDSTGGHDPLGGHYRTREGKILELKPSMASEPEGDPPESRAPSLGRSAKPPDSRVLDTDLPGSGKARVDRVNERAPALRATRRCRPGGCRSGGFKLGTNPRGPHLPQTYRAAEPWREHAGLPGSAPPPSGGARLAPGCLTSRARP